MTRTPEPMRYVLARPIVSAPGVSWRYSGGTTQVLATIVQRATKQPLADYARTVLFSPLGISDFEWLGDLGGVPSAASGLRLRPRDLAKFASLYLHDGQWNGRQVIPREWVHESTRRRLSFPSNPRAGTPISGGTRVIPRLPVPSRCRRRLPMARSGCSSFARDARWSRSLPGDKMTSRPIRRSVSFSTSFFRRCRQRPRRPVRPELSEIGRILH